MSSSTGTMQSELKKPATSTLRHLLEKIDKELKSICITGLENKDVDVKDNKDNKAADFLIKRGIRFLTDLQKSILNSINQYEPKLSDHTVWVVEFDVNDSENIEFNRCLKIAESLAAIRNELLSLHCKTQQLKKQLKGDYSVDVDENENEHNVFFRKFFKHKDKNKPDDDGLDEMQFALPEYPNFTDAKEVQRWCKNIDIKELVEKYNKRFDRVTNDIITRLQQIKSETAASDCKAASDSKDNKTENKNDSFAGKDEPKDAQELAKQLEIQAYLQSLLAKKATTQNQRCAPLKFLSKTSQVQPASGLNNQNVQQAPAQKTKKPHTSL